MDINTDANAAPSQEAIIQTMAATASQAASEEAAARVAAASKAGTAFFPTESGTVLLPPTQSDVPASSITTITILSTILPHSSNGQCASLESQSISTSSLLAASAASVLSTPLSGLDSSTNIAIGNLVLLGVLFLGAMIL